MGIQVCDQPGRVNAIIPTPNGQASNVYFGGEKLDSLSGTTRDKVSKRRLKANGTNAFDSPKPSL